LEGEQEGFCKYHLDLQVDHHWQEEDHSEEEDYLADHNPHQWPNHHQPHMSDIKEGNL
jgi:hypothetical protein